MIPILNLSNLLSLLSIVLMPADFSTVSSHKIKNETKGFALVELFTSEGCSSCPPADAAVAAVAEKYPDNVYILGYHVDYWNYLGWKDEYSSKTFTDRQRKYSQAFNLNSIYTPQIVINGKAEFVGSDRNKLQQKIKEALEEEQTSSFEITAKAGGENKIVVQVTISKLEKNEEINIALVQRMVTTKVKRGENNGKELKHINIVRELKIINSTIYPVEFTIPALLTSKDVKIIAFIQDKNNLNVRAATKNSL